MKQDLAGAVTVETVEDEKRFEMIWPALRGYVAATAAKRGESFEDAANWLIQYAANRLRGLDKYESGKKCGRCNKLTDKCKCTPAEIAAMVAARPRRDDW